MDVDGYLSRKFLPLSFAASTVAEALRNTVLLDKASAVTVQLPLDGKETLYVMSLGSELSTVPVTVSLPFLAVTL